MKKAVILVVSMMVMLMLITIALAYFAYVVQDKKSSDRNLAYVKAFYIAEAGLENGLSRLKSGVTGALTQNFSSGHYTVTATNLGVLTYRIDSTGQALDAAGNVLATKTVTIYAKETPFNIFSYFTNSEFFTQCNGNWCTQTAVWFITGDKLTGPVFTNSEFHMSGSPSFFGPVGSASNQIAYLNGGPPNDNPYFDPAYNPNPDLGHAPINMPTFADSNLQQLKTQALQLNGDTTIVFVKDGTMTVTCAGSGYNNANMPIPANQGVYIKGGDLTVSGVVKGQVTVAADVTNTGTKGNVVIGDNTRFASRYDAGNNLIANTGLAAGSTDYLGIVAAADVIISKNAPNNIEVDASAMALGDSFIVERWYDTAYNKGTLTVLGGIIQDERGPVGTFANGSKKSGYYKNYIYDNRLLNTQLPYFPTTGEFTINSWQN